MSSFNNYDGTQKNTQPIIYDMRFGCRYFKTTQERDAYYNNATWIDQKHWHKQN